MEAGQRALVTEEAMTWIGTPVHHAAALKGAGVDCGYLALAVHAAAGVCEFERLPYYSPQWLLHGTDEMYVRELSKRCREVTDPLPGDVALFKVAKVYGHGAIVIDWPMVVHAAWKGGKVELADASKYPLAGRAIRFFSPWGR